MKKLFAWMGAALLTATLAMACSKKKEAKEPGDLSGTGDMGGAQYGGTTEMGGSMYGGGMYGNPCGGNPCGM